MAGEFWLDDRQWMAIEAHLPRNRPGARRVDDRRVLGGIIHVLKSGCRWQDCPAVYGPPATIYNRFHCRSGRGLRQFLQERGGLPVTPNNPARKHRHPFDRIVYRQRNPIGKMFYRLKDFRRIATRYGKLAANFAATVRLAATLIRRA